MTTISSPARRDSALIAAESLTRARSVVTPAMDAAVLRLCPALRPAVREHLAGGGKFVSAGLTLVSAAAAGAARPATASPERPSRAAASESRDR